MKLTVKKSDFLDDWWTIERAEHDNRAWLETTTYGSLLQCSSRFSDADVEGPGGEMLAIADAIERRGSVSFRRCSVRVEGDAVSFRSPRNSQVDGVVTLAEADELAREIREKVPG